MRTPQLLASLLMMLCSVAYGQGPAAGPRAAASSLDKGSGGSVPALSSSKGQAYPVKPIRVIVPFAPGSGTDILARILTEDLRAGLGWNFVVDNRAGGSAQIAAELAARAAPDGYTLLLSTNTPHSANPFLFKKLNYDPIRDFAAVGRVIHYLFMFVDWAASQGHVRAGRLRAVGVMSDHRSKIIPDLPAVGETVPGFDATPWAGFFTPAGTSKAIITSLNSEIVRTINKPAVNQKLIEMGLEPVPSSPEELNQFVLQQLKNWGKKIRDAGIQPE